MAATLSQTIAVQWCVFGAAVAFVGVGVLPYLLAEQDRERATGIRYRPTMLSVAIGVVALALAVSSGVVVALALRPCTKGDAVLAGLGAIALVTSLSSLGSLLVRRDDGLPTESK